MSGNFTHKSSWKYKYILVLFWWTTKLHSVKLSLLKYVDYSGATGLKSGFLRHRCKEEQIDLKGNSIAAFGYLQRKTITHCHTINSNEFLQQRHGIVHSFQRSGHRMHCGFQLFQKFLFFFCNIIGRMIMGFRYSYIINSARHGHYSACSAT